MPDSPAVHPRVPRDRLEDVARAAGVSKSTVSRVLSGDATLSVRDETRERVRALAQELGYRPHPVARALATPATGALALLVPTLSNPPTSRSSAAPTAAPASVATCSCARRTSRTRRPTTRSRSWWKAAAWTAC